MMPVNVHGTCTAAANCVCCLNEPSVGEESVTGCDAVRRDSSESVWTSSRGVYTMYGTVEKVQHSLKI